MKWENCRKLFYFLGVEHLNISWKRDNQRFCKNWSKIKRFVEKFGFARENCFLLYCNTFKDSHLTYGCEILFALLGLLIWRVRNMSDKSAKRTLMSLEKCGWVIKVSEREAGALTEWIYSDWDDLFSFE